MASANAAPPPALVIEWEAPPDCPDAERVRGAVWAAVGTAHSANVSARAVVTKTPGGRFRMQLAIEADGASETKTLDADTCGTLADAYAVIVAFRFDPEAAGRTPSPVHVAPAPHADEPSAPVATPSRPRVLRLGAGPLFATSAGVLPFPAYGIGAAIEAEYALRWSVGATYWPEQTSWSTIQVYGEAVQLVSAQPSACVPVAGGVVAFCAGVEAGAMIGRGKGTGLVRSNRGFGGWLSFTLGAELEVPVTRFVALRVRLDGGVPVFRPVFAVDNAGGAPPYQPGPVFGLLRLEPLFRFFATDSDETRHVPR